MTVTSTALCAPRGPKASPRNARTPLPGLQEPSRPVWPAAQRVEHYEMAGYGTVRTYARLLGHNDWAQLLQQTLDEEKEADRILNGLAESINLEAKAA